MSRLDSISATIESPVIATRLRRWGPLVGLIALVSSVVAATTSSVAARPAADRAPGATAAPTTTLLPTVGLMTTVPPPSTVAPATTTPSAPTTVVTATTTPVTPTVGTATTTTLSAAVIPASLTGPWQGLQSNRRPLAYDVPAAWTVLSPDWLSGFEWEDPAQPSGYSQIIFSAMAKAPDRVVECAAAPPYTAAIGSNGGESDLTDTAAIAASIAGTWASRAYSPVENVPAEYVLTSPEPWTTTSGLSGHLVRADVVTPCAPGTASAWTFTFPAPDLVGIYNVIVLSDGDPTGAAEQLARTMLATVRYSPIPPE